MVRPVSPRVLQIPAESLFWIGHAWLIPHLKDIDLPKKPSEVGIIRKLFLDPTASHLIICTTLGENFYLHAQTRQPKQLSRLRGIAVESISWNPSQPTASTREILIGAADGNVYETYIESTKWSLEKYLKLVYKVEGPVSGIWTDLLPGKLEMRRIMVATPKRLLHFCGKLGKHGSEGSGSTFAKLFELEAPIVREIHAKPTTAALGITPESPDMPLADTSKPERIFAWLSAEGVLHGQLRTTPQNSELGSRVLSESRMLETSQVRPNGRPIPSGQSASHVALTQWHILQLIGNRIVATNRLDGSVVFDQAVLDSGQRPLALAADLKKNTFWLFTTRDIFEIVVRDEDRDVWKVMLKAQKFEAALQYANNASQKDTIATASGDYLISQGQFMEAASVFGKSSKAFEQVALAFIDKGEKDALRTYLLTKLATMKTSATMQRIMLTSWLTEIFMSKLNALDDMVNTKAELAEHRSPDEIRQQRTTVRREFEDFIKRYKADLDKKTIYDIISSHGRENELLSFSTAMGDDNYVLSYWVQRENWSEALKALNKQTDANLVYKYSSVLMANAATQFVDIIMRQQHLEARKLIPAFLNYNSITEVALGQNQAIRYLLYEINYRNTTDAAVHNTLISLYASSPSQDESALLAYLESQTPSTVSTTSSQTSALDQLPYDADFALRLCIQHSRIRACCLIYTTMSQPHSAVTLALAHKQTDLAMSIASRPEAAQSPALAKKLWLAIARAIITDPTSTSLLMGSEKQPKGPTTKQQAQDSQQSASITTALSLLHRAHPPGILRIEDLLPLLPDFVLIDAFKDEICSALASYTKQIEDLKADMDSSASTSSRLKREIDELDNRWVLLEPGESCVSCGEVLLEKRFWVWACGHGAHSECAVDEVQERSGRAIGRRVKELRTLLRDERRRKEAQAELDEIVGKECLRCGDIAVRGIDEPFVKAGEDAGDWSL